MEKQKKFPVDFLDSPYDVDVSTTEKYLEGVVQEDIIEKFQCQYCSTEMCISEHNTLFLSVFQCSSEDEDADVRLLSLFCHTCEKVIAIRINKCWWKVEDLLWSQDTTRNGISTVKTFGERLVLWVLNRIIYRHYERESDDPEFLTVLPEEVAKLVWKEGEAVGFYTVKPKGMLCEDCPLHCYQIPVVDIVYIRKQHRRHGYGLQMVEDVLNTYPKQNIGFSYKVSDSMLKVLQKYLNSHPQQRDYIWESWGTGAEGFRRNVWMMAWRTII